MSKVPCLSIRTGRLGLGAAAVRRLPDVGRAVCDGAFALLAIKYVCLHPHGYRDFLDRSSFATRTTLAGQVCVTPSFA